MTGEPMDFLLMAKLAAAFVGIIVVSASVGSAVMWMGLMWEARRSRERLRQARIHL